jgi:hypothetical protein
MITLLETRKVGSLPVRFRADSVITNVIIPAIQRPLDYL